MLKTSSVKDWQKRWDLKIHACMLVIKYYIKRNVPIDGKAHHDAL